MDTRDFKIYAELISAYLVDKYCNNIYFSAKQQLTLSGRGTLTDYFIKTLDNYLLGLKQDNLRRKELLNFIEYCKTYITDDIPSIEVVEDKLLVFFMPTDVYRDMTSREKDILLNSIFVTVANELANLVREHLTDIIDKRENDQYARALQRLGVKSMEIRRETTFRELSMTGFKPLSRTGELNAKLKREYLDLLRKVAELEVQLKTITEAKLTSEDHCAQLIMENDDLKKQLESISSRSVENLSSRSVEARKPHHDDNNILAGLQEEEEVPRKKAVAFREKPVEIPDKPATPDEPTPADVIPDASDSKGKKPKHLFVLKERKPPSVSDSDSDDDKSHKPSDGESDDKKKKSRDESDDKKKKPRYPKPADPDDDLLAAGYDDISKKR